MMLCINPLPFFWRHWQNRGNLASLLKSKPLNYCLCDTPHQKKYKKKHPRRYTTIGLSDSPEMNGFAKQENMAWSVTRR